MKASRPVVWYGVVIVRAPLRNKEKGACRTHEGLPVRYWRKVGILDESLVIPLPSQGTLQFPHLLLFPRLISVHGQLGFLLLISVQ